MIARVCVANVTPRTEREVWQRSEDLSWHIALCFARQLLRSRSSPGLRAASATRLRLWGAPGSGGSTSGSARAACRRFDADWRGWRSNRQRRRRLRPDGIGAGSGGGGVERHAWERAAERQSIAGTDGSAGDAGGGTGAATNVCTGTDERHRAEHAHGQRRRRARRHQQRDLRPADGATRARHRTAASSSARARPSRTRTGCATTSSRGSRTPASG